MQQEIANLSKFIEEYKESIQDSRQEKERIKSEWDSLISEYREKEKELQKTITELNTKVTDKQNTIDNLNEKYRDVDNKLKSMENDKDLSKKQSKHHETELDSYRRNNQKLDERVTELEEYRKQAEIEKDKLKQEKIKIQEEAMKEKEHAFKLREELEEKKKEIIQQKDTQIDQLQEKLDSSKEQQKQISALFEEYKKSVKECLDKIKDVPETDSVEKLSKIIEGK